VFSFGRLLVIIILLWAALYTGSFGIWTWKKKNKLGAVMVFIVAISVLALPTYTIFFRH
jgi:uncharacterized membrane protein (DUF4010 family)